MEKIAFCRKDGKPIIGRVEYEEAVLKVNEIIEEIKHLWTNLIDLQKEMLKHKKYVEPLEKAWKEAIEQTLKQAMGKKQKQPKATIAGKPGRRITRYELSDDMEGLRGYLANGNFYHIHRDELTHEEILIKIELLGMEGR